MKKTILTIAAAALLTGCYGKPESTAPAGDFKISRLFEHDGCTVYRFWDGNYRYFARCDGSKQSEVSWSEACGKGCTHHQSIPTGRP